MLGHPSASAMTCVAVQPREDTPRPSWRCSTALRLVPAPVPAEASTPCTLRLRFPPCSWSMRDEVGSTQANGVAMRERCGTPRVGVRKVSAARGRASRGTKPSHRHGITQGMRQRENACTPRGPSCARCCQSVERFGRGESFLASPASPRSLLDHGHERHTAQGALGGLERFESQHWPGDPLHGAMVLWLPGGTGGHVGEHPMCPLLVRQELNVSEGCSQAWPLVRNTGRFSTRKPPWMVYQSLVSQSARADCSQGPNHAPQGGLVAASLLDGHGRLPAGRRHHRREAPAGHWRRYADARRRARPCRRAAVRGHKRCP